MKKLLNLEINSGMTKLDKKSLSNITGGLMEAAASGKTRTASGASCDNTAVCNCVCPIIKPKSFEDSVEF